MLYYFRNLTEECLEDNILWNRYGNNFPYYYYVKAKDTTFVRNYKFKVGGGAREELCYKWTC